MEKETNCKIPYYSVVVVGSGSKCLNGNFLQPHHHLCQIHHLAEQSSLTARKLRLERLMHLSRKLIGGGLQHQSTYLCRLLFASFLNVRNVSVISSRFTAEERKVFPLVAAAPFGGDWGHLRERCGSNGR